MSLKTSYFIIRGYIVTVANVSTAICWTDLQTDSTHFHFNGRLKGFHIIRPTNYNENHLTLDIGHCNTKTNSF